jgi:signal transduction histidine kinase
MRLWVKLALLASVGFVLMHALHLALGTRIGDRALAEEEARLGARIARLVAQQAVDPLLVDDPVTLDELVSSAAVDEEGRVSYCFIVRNGAVVASSFRGPTPRALVRLRTPEDLAPVLIRTDEIQILDVAAPILGGEVGTVRLGLDLRTMARARRTVAIDLGLLAAGMIVAGIAAALFIGRSIARPVGEILHAADRFDPASGEAVPAVTPRGSREIAVLADRFNRMMLRLQAAHAEQARARQKSVETQRLAAMGSLVAGVAHEVNNPLAGIMNCLRRLERGDLTEPKRREYLSLMEEGLHRIGEVVQQLLDFGRPHPPRLEPIPPARLASEAAALIRPALEQRGIRIEVLGDVPSPALADRHLAEQALLNLLLNAAYVTADSSQIRLRLRKRDGLVGLAVEDDGPGIPPEIRGRILDPFFSTKPAGDGTGLGLSVTRTIADAHGGELTFEFPERGTIATIWLREAGAAACDGSLARASPP